MTIPTLPPVTLPADPCACGRRHRSPATAARCPAARATTSPDPETDAPEDAGPLVSATDVRTVLGSRWGVLAHGTWGLVGMPYPYRSARVVLGHEEVVAWWHACGGNVKATAEALSADLEWVAAGIDW